MRRNPAEDAQAPVERPRYYDTLAGVQLKDKWDEWVNFFALAVESSANESVRTGMALQNLLSRWKSSVDGQKKRADAVLYRFPELMIQMPVLTAHRAKDALGVSFPAASAALNKLERMGILFRRGGKLRNRVFVAKEVIDILNRPSRAPA